MSSVPDRGSSGGLDKDTRRRMTIALCDQPVITQLVDTALASKLKREENKRQIALEQKADAKAKAKSLGNVEEHSNKGDVTLLRKLTAPTLFIMDFDEITYARNEATKAAWLHHMASIGGNILKLASKYCNDQPCYAEGIRGGAFNYCIRVGFDKEEGVEAQWLMRFPIPGRVMHPEAKVRHEVAVMRYLYEKTSIPVPKIIAWGTAEENIFEGVGPFIIMEFVEGKPLYEVMRGTPMEVVFRETNEDEFLKELARKADAGEGDNEVLSPCVDDATLEIIYRQLANVYLELSEHDFDKIGSLDMDDSSQSEWKVTAPPYTNLTNELERVGGVPKEDRLGPFLSSTDYLLNQAQQKIQAMHTQRTSVNNVEYGRKAYVAAHLFRTSVPTFLDHKYNKGPFKLVCDDLRPGNILVDHNLKITAICDWEWTYAAPYQQFYSAPRWLLLKAPEEWDRHEPYDGGEGDDDMLKSYRKKLDLFLKVMEEEEHKRASAKLSSPLIPHPNRPQNGATTAPAHWFHPMMDDGDIPHDEQMAAIHADKPFTPTHTPMECNMPEEEPLSSLMRKSLSNGQFWFNEYLRAYDFDFMYWDRLHVLHYGSNIPPEECVKVWASFPQNLHIEGFIEKKLRDLEEYRKELATLEQENATKVNEGGKDQKENEKVSETKNGATEEQDVATAAEKMAKVIRTPPDGGVDQIL